MRFRDMRQRLPVGLDSSRVGTHPGSRRVVGPSSVGEAEVWPAVVLVIDDAGVGEERRQLAETGDDVCSVVRVGSGTLRSAGDTEVIEHLRVEAE